MIEAMACSSHFIPEKSSNDRSFRAALFFDLVCNGEVDAWRWGYCDGY
jgi:hypothetical protein